MENKLQNLRKAMNSSTHKGTHFTNEHKQQVRNRVQSDHSISEKRPHNYFIYAISTFSILIVILLISSEMVGKINLTSNNNQVFFDANDIKRVLIAESISETNNGFRHDFKQGRLGIVQIDDHIWNQFTTTAFTFSSNIEKILHQQSNYDMVIDLGNEQISIKIWILNNEVYYTQFQSGLIHKMEKEQSNYFINAIATIFS